MRQVLAVPLAVVIVGGAVVPALAQADRYGGVGSYRAPANLAASVPAPARARPPERVLTWPGKSLAAAQPQPQPYGYPAPRQGLAQPGYAPAPQPAGYAQPYGSDPRGPAQSYAPAGYGPPRGAQPAQPPLQAAYPSPYQPQPYYAPAPGGPQPAYGSTATAPSGVYPPNTAPPQLAYPMAVPPQQSQPMVSNPQPPSSIYAPTSQPVGPARPASTVGAAAPAQQLAANTGQSARYYSLHRQFGLQPDRTPMPPPKGQAVELVSSIDSGVGVDPPSDARTRIVSSSKAKSAQTASLRDGRGASEDAN